MGPIYENLKYWSCVKYCNVIRNTWLYLIMYTRLYLNLWNLNVPEPMPDTSLHGSFQEHKIRLSTKGVLSDC